MSCHRKTVENVLEVLSLCIVQKQCFFTEDVVTTKEPMNRSSFLVPSSPFLLCSLATKVWAPGARKMNSNISFLEER